MEGREERRDSLLLDTRSLCPGILLGTGGGGGDISLLPALDWLRVDSSLGGGGGGLGSLYLLRAAGVDNGDFFKRLPGRAGDKGLSL